MSGDSVVYLFSPPPASEPGDEVEWLLSALEQYTSAELRELLYIAQEPGFFELMRSVFALPDEARATLQQFLAVPRGHTTTARIDADGRCILTNGTSEARQLPRPRIAH
jgi:hypothetical protein